MDSRRFTKLNEPFCCENCGEKVPPSGSTCRNHCPFCLFSKHVDVQPGDRKADCGGLLEPIEYWQSPKKGIVLRFRCQRCGYLGQNKACLDDSFQSDDFDKILQIQIKQ